MDRAKRHEDVRAARTQDVLFHSAPDGGAQLFQLQHDPGALEDVGGARPGDSARFSERLAAWEQLRAERSQDWRDDRPAVENDAATRASLEALGYLGGEGH